MTTAEETIQAFYADWFGAMQRGDVAASLELVTDDVLLKSPAAPAVEGKQALTEALTAFHARFAETVRYDIAEIEVAGEWAYALVHEDIVLRPKAGGAETSVSGMHLGVLRRVDGAWRLARDVSSLNQVPPPLEIDR